MKLHELFERTDFVHESGTPEELRVAELLRAECEKLGVPARLEPFRVAMGDIEEARVIVDGQEIPCRGLRCCGSGAVEGELYYMPGSDPVSLAGARDKIVLLDSQGVSRFGYQDLMKAGAKALLFQCGDVHYPNRDIDRRDLRELTVGDEKRVLCAMLHRLDAIELVKHHAKHARIEIRQREYDGASHNVVAELPGAKDEWIVFTAHYDTTSLSHGAYDNMSGCAGLLGVMEAMKDAPRNCGLRFIFCGSEERGLLGSKAYVRDHRDELDKIALDVNLDMIGARMGKFVACAAAEDRLCGYITYLGAELGFPVTARTGVSSSDSASFADAGVPAVTFARGAGGAVAPIHCRYDTVDVLSMEQLQKDIDFLTAFTKRMCQSVLCPVEHKIPENIQKELDEYFSRKKKEK